MPSILLRVRASIVSVVFMVMFALPLLADDKSEPPVPIRTVPPEVPVSFIRSGESGLVTVKFTVDEKGVVLEPAVVKSTHHILEEPAIKAVLKWRFKPATKDGAAVATHVTIPLKFEAQ